jgi:cyclopropane fatty-acyl-phospholipid synthase-like methyltransferase
MTNGLEIWEEWNRNWGPRYPHEKVIQFCFRSFPRKEDRRRVKALDLGCGGGVHTVFLAEEGFTVTGVDLSATGIETTRARLAEKGLEATLQLQALEDLDLPAMEFGLVVCTGVLDAVGPRIAGAGLRRLPGCLQPGALGLFMFASQEDFRVNGPNEFGMHGYSREEVERLFGGLFERVWIDQYSTTYQGGTIRQIDWLVTVKK